MRVLSVASEVYPLVKTGGLADVAGALPGALSAHGIAAATLVPGYPAVMDALARPKTLHSYPALLGEPARLVAGEAGGLQVIVLDAPGLYARDGGPYADAQGRDWDDNWLRFAALARAGADLASGVVGKGGFDLLHAHDWQGAMAAAYLRFSPRDRPRPPAAVTIHNIAFPGRFDAGVFGRLDLPIEAWALEGVEYFGGVGFLKAGLVSAQAITTVSPTYAEEIATPAFGMGLEGLIRTRSADVVGIVNGVDISVWDPKTDPHLAARYSRHRLEARGVNKAAVEAAFALETGDGPLFCVVSRLTRQKGMDQLAAELDNLVAAGGRLALLGSGDADLEGAFLAAMDRHPGRVGVRIGYDEALSHLLQGGADAILIPSRFEPCGLTQLYGLRYGCVPVVAHTGGLADTVIDANAAAVQTGVATGVVFVGEGEGAGGLRAALRRTMGLYARPDIWRAMQAQGMKADVSWAASGARYAELFRRLVAGAAGSAL